MKKHLRGADGKYHIGSNTYSQLTGSRAQVWHGTSYQTPGGLNKSDLMKNKTGNIVSKLKHNTAKKEKRLAKHGWGTKKGKFGAVRLDGSKSKRNTKSNKSRGGSGYIPLSPSGIDGQGITYTNPNLGSANIQELAGMAGGKRRRSRGGFFPLSPSGIDGQGITNYGGPGEPNAPTGMALSAGGKRGKSRRSRGGYYALSPSGIDGQGITNYSASGSLDVQEAASSAGGRKSRRRRY